MNEHNTLAELATGSTAAARVLQRHGLDFCCGGKQTLEEACGRKGLNAGTLYAEIAGAGAENGDTDPSDLSSAQLVDHILRRYHEPLRPELTRLIEMARRAEKVHGRKPEWPIDLVRHLEKVRDAIEAHLAKEEQILFPTIRAGRGHLAHMPIQVMIHEHQDHGADLERSRELTNGYRPPAAACTTWRALYEGLNELELDLMKHIHLENNLLFPKVLRGGGEKA